jgi:glycosyltransferase involved in cell wall biosynthesis
MLELNKELFFYLSRPIFMNNSIMAEKCMIIRATTIPLSLNAFCKGMLKELSEKYEVVALSSPGAVLEEVAKREGVRTIAVPMERHISLAKDFISLIKIIGIFHDERPMMIHSMTPKAGLLCMIAGKLTRVPVRVHTFTGLVWPTKSGIKRRILMFTDRLTCACATHIIPEGEGVKKDLLSNGITKKPIRVLGFGNVRGVDMDLYSRRPEVMDIVSKKGLISHDVFTFLYVGRIVRDKGINELCHAFSRIHNKINNTRLLLVGDYEDELDPVSNDTKNLINNESNSILSIGWKNGDELLAYYAVADCFVLPSYREGFPNTVLEAGAMGLPSIVTSINGSREIIIEGKNGMIVPPRDEEGLYRAMMVMVKSNVERKRMAENARKLIADRYEQGFVRKCLYDFYDEVLAPFQTTNAKV